MAEVRPSWDQFFMSMACKIAERSKDPSTKTGAVIVDQRRRIIGLGYNGFPRGVADTDERLYNRPVKYKFVVHSEANAILNARGCEANGASIYVTKFPCTDCAKLIIQSGILRLYYPKDTSESAARWAEDAEYSREMLLEAGVLLIQIG